MCSVKERECALYGGWKISEAGAAKQSEVLWSDQFILVFNLLFPKNRDFVCLC